MFWVKKLHVTSICMQSLAEIGKSIDTRQREVRPRFKVDDSLQQPSVWLLNFDLVSPFVGFQNFETNEMDFQVICQLLNFAA